MAKKKLTEDLVDLIENVLEERKPGTDRRGNRTSSDTDAGNFRKDRRTGSDRRSSGK